MRLNLLWNLLWLIMLDLDTTHQNSQCIFSLLPQDQVSLLKINEEVNNINNKHICKTEHILFRRLLQNFAYVNWMPSNPLSQIFIMEKLIEQMCAHYHYFGSYFLHLWDKVYWTFDLRDPLSCGLLWFESYYPAEPYSTDQLHLGQTTILEMNGGSSIHTGLVLVTSY
jgi:hypothetical protein